MEHSFINETRSQSFSIISTCPNQDRSWYREWVVGDGRKEGSGNRTFCKKHFSSTYRLRTHLTICPLTPQHVENRLDDDGMI